MSPEPDAAVLIRHAQTEWSVAGRHTGRSDLALTEQGRDTAAGLGPRLARWSFALVLCSPLARARETAELSGLGGRAQMMPELMEWDYGSYEGLTSAQIRESRPDWNLWREGCPGGERPAEVAGRAQLVIERIRSAAGPVAVFSHGHMLRVLGVCWTELGVERGANLGLSTAAICALSREHGTPAITLWNETSGGADTGAAGVTR